MTIIASRRDRDREVITIKATSVSTPLSWSNWVVLPKLQFLIIKQLFTCLTFAATQNRLCCPGLCFLSLFFKSSPPSIHRPGYCLCIRLSCYPSASQFLWRGGGRKKNKTTYRAPGQVCVCVCVCVSKKTFLVNKTCLHWLHSLKA